MEGHTEHIDGPKQVTTLSHHDRVAQLHLVAKEVQLPGMQAHTFPHQAQEEGQDLGYGAVSLAPEALAAQLCLSSQPACDQCCSSTHTLPHPGSLSCYGVKEHARALALC